MKVKDLIELLHGCNQDYEVSVDIPRYDLGDSFITDTSTQTIFLELCTKRGIKYEDYLDAPDFVPSNYATKSVDI